MITMTTTKRTLGIILAVFMLVSAIPFTAYAATALKSSNVTQWPTLSYKSPDGKMYFGQTQTEGLIINDDEIVLDTNGNQVAGYFTFKSPDNIPTPGTNKKLNITFIPENTDEYTGFSKMFSSLTYDVIATTPIYVDEVNDPVIATEVEAGATLSSSTLSGGAMTNPYNSEEPNILARSWEWTDTTTIVNESGYYEAIFAPSGYTPVTAQVYVKIAGSIPETEIIETPTITDFTYNPNITWKDVEINGGKAILKVEGTEVAGTFAVADKAKDWVPIAGTHAVPVVFTPNDLEAALPYSFEITNVVVHPATIAFVDNEGNVIDNYTFEVEPGVKMNDVKALIQANLRTPKNAVIGVEDNNGYAENGRKYKLTVNHDDSNYEGTELYFTIKFKETEITPSLKWVGAGKLKVDCGDYSPPGSFAVYYVIGETETKIGDVKGNSEILEWTPTSSGDYGFKVVYNPVENDYFIIESVTTTPYSYYPEHKVISTGNMVATHKMGEAVTVTAVPTDPEKAKTPFFGFKGWTDVKGNTGLTDEDLKSAEITFTMPDGDVELTASYAFSFLMLLEYIYTTLVNFFASVVNSIATLF